MFLPFMCLHVVALISGGVFENVDALAIWFCISSREVWFNAILLQDAFSAALKREYMLCWTTDPCVCWCGMRMRYLPDITFLMETIS